MPTFIQKSLSSSLELLQSVLAAGQEQLSDESGRMSDVLEPSLFLKIPDDPKGHKISLAASLASLQMKRLRGKWETAVPWSRGPHLFGNLPSCTNLCMLPSVKQMAQKCMR